MGILSNFPESRGLNTDDINDIADGEISNGFVQSSFNYSTEETIVGKWVDGKPLYQRTLTNISIPSNSSSSPTYTYLDVSSYNIDKMISVEGNLSSTTYKFTTFFPQVVSGSSPTRAVGATYYWSSHDTYPNKLLLYSTQGYDFQQCNLTLLYTKTTD